MVKPKIGRQWFNIQVESRRIEIEFIHSKNGRLHRSAPFSYNAIVKMDTDCKHRDNGQNWSICGCSFNVR